jgi:epoxyqueuosine reductase QueG
LRRNALIAAGNSGAAVKVDAARRMAEGDDEMLRDTAEWALGRTAQRG